LAMFSVCHKSILGSRHGREVQKKPLKESEEQSIISIHHQT
jgi:hypothetical protein